MNENIKNSEDYLGSKARSDGFYCVRQQRDPDANPGNKPCPDTDKCHFCGQCK